jgi:hypothetical protein
MPIPEKMYPNLLTDITTKDLESKVDLVELIWLYNAGWYRYDGGEAMLDECVR